MHFKPSHECPDIYVAYVYSIGNQFLTIVRCLHLLQDIDKVTTMQNDVQECYFDNIVLNIQ